MDISKEKLLSETYQNYLDLMLEDYPIENMDEFIAEDVTGYGSTIDEKIHNIDRLRKLVIDQRNQSKGLDLNYNIKSIVRRISPDEDIAIYNDQIDISIKMDGKNKKLTLRISSIFEYIENKWRLVHFHGSTAVETENDTWHLNEWKKKAEALERKVEERTAELRASLKNLKATQSQLIQSEKMASLGELTAGIAHEIQNPLNFVNNFSELSEEMLEELAEELPNNSDEIVTEILTDLKQNLNKITTHGKRASNIVKGMLEHSRTSSGVKELTDVNALADEFLRLSYHGLRAKDKTFNANFKTNFDTSLPKIEVIAQDLGRVILNLINNAFYACAERSRSTSDKNYKPTVTVSTKKIDDTVEIRVKDNGSGIPKDIKEKIFQPFFTTKPTGEGTGLGLSMSYDIVTKGHGGELKVESKEGVGTEFAILLPIKMKNTN